MRLLEISFDQASPTALKDTADSIALVKSALGDSMCVGAGTVMTSEMHSVLMQHSLVGLGTPEQIASPEVFAMGLKRGFEENNFLVHLFEIRASHILKRIQPSEVSKYLSGLLIGAEIASVQKVFRFSADDGPLAIIASPFLAERYAQGLKLAGLESLTLDGDECFLKGILPFAGNL